MGREGERRGVGEGIDMKGGDRIRGAQWVEVSVKAVHYSAEAREAGMATRADGGSEKVTSTGRPSPVRWKRRTVNRSPHGNKTAREQFVQKVHGRTRGGRERRWGGEAGRTSAEGRAEGRGQLTRKRKRAEQVWKGGFLKVRVEGGRCWR